MIDTCIRSGSARVADTQEPLPTVALVVSDGMSPFHLAGALLVLSKDSDGQAPVDLRVCALGPDPVRTSVDFEISRFCGIDVLDDAEAVIIPGWPSVRTKVPERLSDALRRAQVRGAQIMGMCLGVFVLARAGILDGRPATTHWHYAGQLKQQFPQVDVNGDILYVREGNVWTSAGGAAAIDTCLLLLEELRGSKVAQQVASRIVSGPHRHGGNSQIVRLPASESALEQCISEIRDRVRSSPGEPHSVEALSARAQVSVRTFNRRFKMLTGSTYARWLLAQRLAYARRLLDSTSVSVEMVATMSGFNSTRLLLRHFKQAFGEAPSEHRRNAQKTRLGM